MFTVCVCSQRMRLLLLKEKYLELLEEGNTFDALKCLRCEIAPLRLHHSDKDVQILARFVHSYISVLFLPLLCCHSYMMYSTREELHKAADWPGAQRGAREHLMDQLQGKMAVIGAF